MSTIVKTPYEIQPAAGLDVQEVCGKARERAIFQGSMADLIFNAKDATMVVGAAVPAAGALVTFLRRRSLDRAYATR